MIKTMTTSDAVADEDSNNSNHHHHHHHIIIIISIFKKISSYLAENVNIYPHCYHRHLDKNLRQKKKGTGICQNLFFPPR